MNQGKLEVVKQEMARVYVDILGISELKWTGTGEFNSDDHYIYYCGQESHPPMMSTALTMESLKLMRLCPFFDGLNALMSLAHHVGYIFA